MYYRSCSPRSRLISPAPVRALATVRRVPTSASCRQAAVEAAARGDYEAFHDLAWRAAQKGRPNDPELMYLLARAQSLSGRPGDALVMLRRLAQLGVPTDARDNQDFERVRRLPGWADARGPDGRGDRARPTAAAAAATPPATATAAAPKPSSAPTRRTAIPSRRPRLRQLRSPIRPPPAARREHAAVAVARRQSGRVSPTTARRGASCSATATTTS